MTQGLPFQVGGGIYDASGKTNQGARVNVDGALLMSSGAATALAVTAATLLDTGAGRVVRVIVVTASSSAGTINDSATTGAAATANAILTIPANAAAGTIYVVDAPYVNGLVAAPGASGQWTLTYNP